MQKSANLPVAQSEGVAPATMGKQPSLSQFCAQYQCSEKGLSTQEARQRLVEYGPNEPTAVRRAAMIRQLLVFIPPS